MSQLLQSDAERHGNATAARDSDIHSRLYRLLNLGRPAPQSSFLPIAEDLPIAVYITDLEGFVIYHNAAAAALWGHHPAPREVRWCGSHALFSRDCRPLAHEDSPMARVGCNGFGAASEMIAQRRDGKRYTFVPHSKALTDKTGRIMGAVHLILDVSDRDRSEEETARGDRRKLGRCDHLEAARRHHHQLERRCRTPVRLYRGRDRWRLRAHADPRRPAQ
jgi:PAS domain S-box-containing protein